MKAKPKPKAVTKLDEKQPAAPMPALAVFGTDRSGKPHAAWFTTEEAEAARTAAGLVGYRVLALTTEAQSQVAAKLSRGRLFENGRAFVPFVKAALYQTLSNMAEDAPRALKRHHRPTPQLSKQRQPMRVRQHLSRCAPFPWW
jgi:hypothetical protein